MLSPFEPMVTTHAVGLEDNHQMNWRKPISAKALPLTAGPNGGRGPYHRMKRWHVAEPSKIVEPASPSRWEPEKSRGERGDQKRRGEGVRWAEGSEALPDLPFVSGNF